MSPLLRWDGRGSLDVRSLDSSVPKSTWRHLAAARDASDDQVQQLFGRVEGRRLRSHRSTLRGMAACAYTLTLAEDFIADLERMAAEASQSPSELLPRLTGDLRGRSVDSIVTVATATGYDHRLTGGSRDYTG
jgi:hypothetical protein